MDGAEWLDLTRDGGQDALRTAGAATQRNVKGPADRSVSRTARDLRRSWLGAVAADTVPPLAVLDVVWVWSARRLRERQRASTKSDAKTRDLGRQGTCYEESAKNHRSPTRACRTAFCPPSPGSPARIDAASTGENPLKSSVFIPAISVVKRR